jgi:hypothetical protein
MRQGPSRFKSASAASASAAQPGRDSQPRAQARDRGRCVEISPRGSSRPPGAGRACARTYGGYARKPSAPQARQRPPRARHRAVNSTPTKHPYPATDGAAANSPPVRSRSRLLAIASPRLTTTGWGPGRYAARASAGPIRNSILSKHLRQLGDVRRDAAGLVPPRPACA